MLQNKSSETTSDSPMCVVKIVGGLGNQMFQYAAGRSVSLRSGCTLTLDLSFFNTRRHRRFELDYFPISARQESGTRGLRGLLKKLTGSSAAITYEEVSKKYDTDFKQLVAPARLSGYFFSEKYFNDCASTIRRELTPPSFADPESIEFSQRISADESIAIHVRRGDYISDKNASQRFCCCSMEYYKQAIKQIPDGGEVFVFSDDIPWTRKNLRSKKPLVFVEFQSTEVESRNAGIRDLWLMSQAHHHIIANSSFSWWGAWLAGPEKGLTFAPKNWFNDPCIDDTDMIPEHWIRL